MLVNLNCLSTPWIGTSRNNTFDSFFVSKANCIEGARLFRRGKKDFKSLLHGQSYYTSSTYQKHWKFAGKWFRLKIFHIQWFLPSLLFSPPSKCWKIGYFSVYRSGSFTIFTCNEYIKTRKFSVFMLHE